MLLQLFLLFLDVLGYATLRFFLVLIYFVLLLRLMLVLVHHMLLLLVLRWISLSTAEERVFQAIGTRRSIFRIP